MEKEKLCECGCGEYAKPGNRYINGHQNRGKEYWKSQGEPKLCECGCGNYTKPGNKYINGHNRRDTITSDIIRKKLSKGQIKRWEDLEQHEKMSKSQIKRFKDPLECEKMLKAAITRWEDPEQHEKMSNIQIERYKDPEQRILASCRMLCISREEWDGFGSLYCELWCEELREHIRNKYNRTCFICSMTEKESLEEWGEKLSVHHVDYNKQCDCDGNECILVPLCKKCHSKTTFGNREYYEKLIMEKLEINKVRIVFNKSNNQKV